MNNLARSLGVCALVLVPVFAAAQSATTGAIAGIAKDTTGAVLPGVTVEASSPALIEKVRTALTDAEGNYKIVDLRPGTYAVTFTLAGFSTFKREGLELTTGFTATVNGEMKVGSIAETVTVSGATPVVDIQNVRTQNVLTRDVLDTVPTGKTIGGYTALTLGASSGASQDVGGTQGEVAIGMAIHGSRLNDSRLKLDGMNYNSLHFEGGGQMRTFHMNQLAVEQASFETSGISAESVTGGVQINFVPKDGSNRFVFQAEASGTGPKLQSSNLSDALIARGLTSTTSTKKVYDFGASLGGPILKDRLWFFQANRVWGAQEYQPNDYYNKTQGQYIGAPNSGVSRYTPDLSRPGYLSRPDRDLFARVTWQVTPKHKVAFQLQRQDACDCLGSSSTAAPETASNLQYGPSNLYLGSWSYPATNKLLLAAGFVYGQYGLHDHPTDGVTSNDIGITEQSTGLAYNALSGQLGTLISCCTYHDVPRGDNRSSPFNAKFTVSYVTGSHALKLGAFVFQGWHDQNQTINQSITYQFFQGVPIGLTEFAVPFGERVRLREYNAFVQDQWTVNRFTLNLGLRYDQFRGYNLPLDVPAGRFVGARHYDGTDDVPNWKDATPRVGVAYDVFGNGKTAVKFAIGRYLGSMGSGLPEQNNPANEAVLLASRTWNDSFYGPGDPRTGNFVPDCTFANLAGGGECGAISNTLFGSIAPTTTWADDVLHGWGVRPYNWDMNVQLQRELRPGTAVNVGYFRRWYGNFWAVQNQAVTAADFTSYCITAPVNKGLSTSGSQLCGLFDVNPGQFGQKNNVITQSSNFGHQTEVFNGVDIALSSRFGKGGMVNGGVSLGRSISDNCFQNGLPQVIAGDPTAGFIGQYITFFAGLSTPRTAAFCHVSPPWSAGTQMKVNGVYPLPFDFAISGTLQNLPGAAQQALLFTPNAAIAPSLRRDLSSGVGGFNLIYVLPNQTQYEDRLTQVDLRLIKTFNVGHARIRAMADVFNVFNASTVLGVASFYGPAWLRPTSTLEARLFKFGGQVDW